MKAAAFGALSLLALSACNTGQPRIYRVAIDEGPVRGIAVPSCFRNNNLPSGRNNTNEQNYRAEDEWVIWNGVDQTEYLDLGTQSWRLGDSPEIRVNELIEGKDKVFTGSRVVQSPQGDMYIYSRQTQIAVTFNDYSFAPTGTIALQAQFACTNQRNSCPTGDAIEPDAASCQANINFVARRIEAQHITAYNNNP